jgi:hypothetical protein
MKFVLTRADGTSLEFEGDWDEFESFREFFEAHATEMLNRLAAKTSPQVPREEPAEAGHDVHDLGEMLDNVAAASDVERLAVMAQFAVSELGTGLTPEKARDWYTRLGIPKPSVWKSTFGNARTRGYIHNSPEGWRPTAAGENFAVHGIRKANSRRKTKQRKND